MAHFQCVVKRVNFIMTGNKSSLFVPSNGKMIYRCEIQKLKANKKETLDYLLFSSTIVIYN
jgi:hypothetical protein